MMMIRFHRHASTNFSHKYQSIGKIDIFGSTLGCFFHNIIHMGPNLRKFSGQRKKKHSKFKFVDKTRVTLIAGTGGNGCISFDTMTPTKKIPTGGHGGQGGNVIIQAHSNVQSLNYSQLTFKAADGKNGKGNRKHGKRGEDKIVKVPLGTIVKEYKNNDELSFNWEETETMEYDSDCEEENDLIFCCDLEKEGEGFVAAVGGKPGLGNQIYKGKTRFHSTMQHHTYGQAGEKRIYELELKTLADIGLVGFPNAGKSTLLGAISRAKPAVGAYPFTTLRPFIGHVEYSDTKVLTVADIPGIIEGAHEGRGLGLQFLRHIERTKALVYVIDAAGVDERSPVDDFNALQKEVSEYSSAVLDKPSIIVANKMDLKAAQHGIKLLKDSIPETYNIFPISGQTGEGITDAVIEMRRLINPPK